MGIKICKCGHLKEYHYPEQRKWYSNLSECRKCKCSEYMNRKFPSKLSFASMVIGIGMSGFAIIPLLSIILIAQLGGKINWNIPSTFTLGDATLVTFALVAGITIFYFYPVMIKPYFKEKQRKTYPIEDNEVN